MTVAIIIPCLNEEAAIGRVVTDFRQALPEATIYVFDNHSDDQTREVALKAGAQVRTVAARGKGNVVRRMFADIEADAYVMVDGDATYDAKAAAEMINTLIDGHLDMVVGCRVEDSSAAYRAGHASGNRLFNGFLSLLFSRPCRDIFSGYRVFSRRFVKSFPAQATGFETETELTVHALELNMPIGYCDTRYGVRPEGSSSKLSTYRDGWRILMMMLRLFRMARPFAFFLLIGIGLVSCALALSIPIFMTYLDTGLVPRIPTAILATGLVLLGALSAFSGLVLDTVAHGRREAKMLAYLSIPHDPVA
jgi:glycosyltransferase involved in cell wall biosynthesis